MITALLVLSARDWRKLVVTLENPHPEAVIGAIMIIADGQTSQSTDLLNQCSALQQSLLTAAVSY